MENLDDALSMVDEKVSGEDVVNTGGAYEIFIKNPFNGMKKTVLVYPENVLIQVFDMYHNALEVNIRAEEALYENVRTRKITTKPDMTMEEFDLKEGDTLEITSSIGGVA